MDVQNIIDIVQSILLPTITVVLGYFGWKATAEKNKLKAQVETIKATNTKQDISNQSSWIELYDRLHTDQAQRILELSTKVNELYKELNTFKNAFRKASSCPHFSICPLRDKLSNSKGDNRGTKTRNDTDNRQREPP